MSDVEKGSATDDVTKNIDQSGAGSDDDVKGGKGESEHDIKKVNVEDLPPETQKIVKGFQASYTKEKQALKAKEDEVNELAKEAQTWKDWATREQPKINEYNEWKKKQAEKGSTNDGTNKRLKSRTAIRRAGHADAGHARKLIGIPGFNASTRRERRDHRHGLRASWIT